MESSEDEYKPSGSEFEKSSEHSEDELKASRRARKTTKLQIKCKVCTDENNCGTCQYEKSSVNGSDMETSSTANSQGDPDVKQFQKRFEAYDPFGDEGTRTYHNPYSKGKSINGAAAKRSKTYAKRGITGHYFNHLDTSYVTTMGKQANRVCHNTFKRLGGTMRHFNGSSYLFCSCTVVNARNHVKFLGDCSLIKLILPPVWTRL